MIRVFWDTNLFVYLIGDQGDLAERVVSLRKKMLQAERKDELYTSSLTLGEVLAKPMQLGHKTFMKQYWKAIEGGAKIIPFDNHAAVHYARIRNDRTIHPADAIQLACAAAAQIDLFITNDERLSEKNVEGIESIVSLEKLSL